MKVILAITSNELKKLFYSPIAWFVLIIFSFQAALSFIAVFGYFVNLQNANAGMFVKDVTYNLFANELIGIYNAIPSTFFIFIPLVTMNIISREKGTGAIKLLYSSPLSNTQIILGKYLALVIFILLLVMSVFVFGLYGMLTVEQVDTGIIFSGLFGVFLLGCAYVAIGLFMSSITVYPIVAAISTICLLGFLHYAGNIGQDIAFVRDITYWLSLRGRVNSYISGMITTEDVIYFIAVVAFALVLAIIRLNAARSKRSRWQVAMQYAFATLVMALTGYFTSMPALKLYWDVTRTQRNTLSAESQQVMNKVGDDIHITSYTNMQEEATVLTALPGQYKTDVKRFEKYTRFKPATRLDYEYYYKKMPTGFYSQKYPELNDEQLMDTLQKQNDYNFKIVPHKNISDTVDLSKENYRFVREIKLGNGKKTFLRVFNDNDVYPDEGQITAAFKRMVDTLPKVGFVTGHGERSPSILNERGYNTFTQEKTFRYSLLNNGFDFEDVSLNAPVPAHISILVIADPREAFGENEMKHFRDYVDNGGNLVIAGEPSKQSVMEAIAAPVGVHFIPGVLYQPKQDVLPEVLLSKTGSQADWDFPWFKLMKEHRMQLVMDQACALEVKDSISFVSTQMVITDTVLTWTELETTDFENNKAVFNPDAGEKKQSFCPALALSRKINQKEQKILVTGDADWLSNMELLTTRRNTFGANFAFICAAFYWLSDGKAPINTTRPDPTDNKVFVTKEGWKAAAFFFKWIIPGILLATGVFIWVRRKRR